MKDEQNRENSGLSGTVQQGEQAEQNALQQNPEQDRKTESDFLKEKIKERPVNKRKLLKRTLITAGLAVVFGLVACLTFSLLEPVISSKVNPEEKAETVTFPEETEELNPKDMAVDDAQLHVKQEEASEESAQQQSQAGTAAETAQAGTSAMETETADQTAATDESEQAEASASAALAGYQQNYDSLVKLTDEVSRSLVTVTNVKTDSSWINDALQNKEDTSGLIIANNGRELLMLVNSADIKGAKSILVTFSDNEQAAAIIKATDQTTGLAVLAVKMTDVHSDVMDHVSVATLGSSTGTGAVGYPVIALGSPAGISNSVYYGIVTSQNTALGLADTDYKLITTDIYGSTDASGILVNLKGQIIGIIYNGYENDEMPNQLCAIGISELKKTIEKLSNNEDMTYLGIHGAEVSQLVRTENNIPYGAYVTSIDMDSPAMKAGVQSGDVITKIDETDISSYAELVSELMKLKIDQEIELTIQRQSQGTTYQEMTVDVTLTGQTQ